VLEVRRRFAEQRLSAPNYRTVVRRVEALDLRLATAKREGSKKARELLAPLRLQRCGPMEVLQIDHTPVDVIVVDQKSPLPWLWLTKSRSSTTTSNPASFWCQNSSDGPDAFAKITIHVADFSAASLSKPELLHRLDISDPGSLAVVDGSQARLLGTEMYRARLNGDQASCRLLKMTYTPWGFSSTNSPQEISESRRFRDAPAITSSVLICKCSGAMIVIGIGTECSPFALSRLPR